MNLRPAEQCPKRPAVFTVATESRKREKKEIIEGYLPFLVGRLFVVPALVMRPCLTGYERPSATEANCVFLFFADLSQSNLRFSLIVRKPDMTYGIPSMTYGNLKLGN